MARGRPPGILDSGLAGEGAGDATEPGLTEMTTASLALVQGSPSVPEGKHFDKDTAPQATFP